MTRHTNALGVALLAAALLSYPDQVFAHCDTLDGPVVADARAALEAGEVSRVLKWVGHEQEAEIREAFDNALTVRTLGPEAQALADRFFFETLVRVHREAEGAPYTGLKPAGTEVDPAVAASDEALHTGDLEPLIATITTAVDGGLRERFARARRARVRADESVERGREYVAAYVGFTHYAEGLSQAASAGHAAHAHPVDHDASEQHRH